MKRESRAALESRFWDEVCTDPLLNIENAEEGPARVHFQGRRGIGRFPDFLRFDTSRSQRKRFWKRANDTKKPPVDLEDIEVSMPEDTSSSDLAASSPV
ncbi:MAG: hypothetical protein JRN62_02360 [Nitrososphaerota archaeon]|nr:hypothetical protein [Nitrososphaerota archaeon]MDG6948855.1 hypothetical protein [Nitrososphaerota archaeon]